MTNWRRKIKREVPGGGSARQGGAAAAQAAALAHAGASAYGHHSHKKPRMGHTIQYDMAAKSAGAGDQFDAVTKCEDVPVSLLARTLWRAPR